MKILAGLVGLILLGLVLPMRSDAGADAIVRWTQAEDCELVDHWVLYANTTPIADLTAVCNGTMAKPVHIAGAGPMTFAMAAITADGFGSPLSNTLTVTIPLAAPTLVEIALP